jgi:hypothetical protein
VIEPIVQPVRDAAGGHAKVEREAVRAEAARSEVPASSTERFRTCENQHFLHSRALAVVGQRLFAAGAELPNWSESCHRTFIRNDIEEFEAKSCLEDDHVRVLCSGESSYSVERFTAFRPQNHFSQLKVVVKQIEVQRPFFDDFLKRHNHSKLFFVLPVSKFCTNQQILKFSVNFERTASFLQFSTYPPVFVSDPLRKILLEIKS